MKPKYCIACEASKSNGKYKATHFVRKNGADWGFCDKHYEQYLIEEEYSINLIEEEYGDYDTEG